MLGALSVANTAVSWPNVAIVDSVDVSNSAVYSRYKSISRTLPCGAPTLTEVEFCVFSFIFHEKVSAMEIRIE
jgi:hypothetical protein